MAYATAIRLEVLLTLSDRVPEASRARNPLWCTEIEAAVGMADAPLEGSTEYDAMRFTG